ncbi:hypothetical protein [Amycolatopsis sp. NPDC051128]|uniref:hypothetical protein n=1 Tax=Amycolatopsis sp. NPDC051128 TaxID=3155412 RepID=UPI003430680A
MTSTAAETDPYLLPLPAPDCPVVPAGRAVGIHAHLNSRYDAAIWSLAPLTENPSESRAALHWRHCPPAFQGELRLVAWTMINGALRPTFLKQRSSRMRARLGSDKVRDTVMAWMQLATWMDNQGMTSLADCGVGVLRDYGLHLAATNSSRATVQMALVALTRLWAFDELSAHPAGVGRPPWDEEGADDYLPAATTGGGENTTEALAEQTMGPLLTWAMRVVDDLATDILAAWSEARRLSEAAKTNRATPASKDALDAYLQPMIAGQAPVPSFTQHGMVRLARTYISGTTGATPGQLEVVSRRERFTELVGQHPGPCPLDIPVTGRIAGRPWRTALDFDEAAELMRHLGTACFIVIAYLTGMRPGEKRAELHLMKHSARSNTDKAAAQGAAWRHACRLIDGFAMASCARTSSTQQCCI